MDSLTHIALGAVIAEVVAGRQLGKRAMIIGAVVNSLPDIDFLAAFWLDTTRDLVFHRGITHSFLFVAVMAVVLGAIGRRVWRSAGIGPGAWIGFMGLELFTHIFIDAFNAYGTGWFEPFSHYRLSFNVLFVADPFYSLWLGLAALALLVLGRKRPARRKWAWMGLVVSSGYLAYALYSKWSVGLDIEQQLQAEGVRAKAYFTTPTPFNSWLWFVVVADSAGYYTGYRSLFDADERPLDLHWQPKNAQQLMPYRDREDVADLLRFAQGCYTVGNFEGRPVLNIVRFGEIQGWRDTAAQFVFHYFLDEPIDNQLVLQRGRFMGWNGEAWRIFLQRIEGD